MRDSWVPLFAVFALALPCLGPAAEPADSELERGIEQVRQGSFDEAAVTLDSVARRLVGSAARLKQLARCRVYLSIAYLELEQKVKADEAFISALEADPGLETTAEEFPPKYLQYFDEVRAEAGLAEAPAAEGAPEAASAKPPPAPGTPPSLAPDVPAEKGGSKTLLILGGVGVAAAVGVAVAAGGGGEDPPPDPRAVDDDGDGFSENQGDCNDRNAAIRPNGGFDFTIAWAFQGGPFNCSQENPRAQTYTVTNNSCETLTLQSLRYTRVGTGTCDFNSDGDLSLRTESIASGGSEIVREGAAAGEATSICCPEYPCRSGTCDIVETVTIATSLGNRSLTNAYSVEDASGYDCHLCGGHFNPMSHSACEAETGEASSPR